MPHDTNGVEDIFVRDRIAGTTARVSVSNSGEQAEGIDGSGSYAASISPDGRFVAFESVAPNLVAGDLSDRVLDVYLHDRAQGTTRKVSVTGTGNNGNAASYGAVVSGDGAYVAFTSEATNFYADDVPDTHDVFVKDTSSGQLAFISGPGTADLEGSLSFVGDISADGRFVAFTSSANSLVADDTNGFPDAFVRDVALSTTTRVSVKSDASQTAGGVSHGQVRISDDGRIAAFTSWSPDLGSGSWLQENVYVRERDVDDDDILDEANGSGTTWVSRRPDGATADAKSIDPSLSADGRSLVFASFASDLVAEDSNSGSDIFQYRLDTRTLSILSQSTHGQQFLLASAGSPSIASGASVVAFTLSETLPRDAGSSALNVFVFEERDPGPSCTSGGYEEGRVSGRVHDDVESRAGPAADTVHRLNCDAVGAIEDMGGAT